MRIRSQHEINAIACEYVLRLMKAFPRVRRAFMELETIQLQSFGINREIIKTTLSLLSALEQKKNQCMPEFLSNNCQSLEQEIGDGNPTGLALLRFSVVYTLHPGLQGLITQAGYLDLLHSRLPVLPALLKVSETRLTKYLSTKNWLADVDFLWRDQSEVLGVCFNIDANIAERLVLSDLKNPIELVSDVLQIMPSSELTLCDYEHMALGDILTHVQMIKSQRMVGWNSLLWGKAGTGKTQFALLLAAEAGLTLYNLRSEDEGPSLHGSNNNGVSTRLNELILAQRLLKNNPDCMLLIDEADDLLLNGMMSKNRRHQLLEENAVPMIWAVNDIDNIDPSSLRRFNWLHHFAAPNPDTKLRLFRKALRGLAIQSARIEKWCEIEWLSQADIQRVSILVKDLGFKGKLAAESVERWFSERAEAMGVIDSNNTSPSSLHMAQRPIYKVEGEYDPSLLNILGKDGHISRVLPFDDIVNGLKRTKEGRILLYGLSGTGKTAFVHYLSKLLDVEIVQKRASDLLHKYVGESEQAIANAFTEAASRGAILFIDEVDSLLMDRRGHKQSWETSQVNELLTQMETFGGILLMASNFIERLDSAVVRRFDYRIELGPLKLDQLASQLKTVMDRTEFRLIQSKLPYLAPVTIGDISILKRRQRQRGRKLLVPEVIDTLEGLIRSRAVTSSRPIGFIVPKQS